MSPATGKGFEGAVVPMPKLPLYNAVIYGVNVVDVELG